ncbi:hypothetical protein ACS0TY_016793 [Phlomoides rotata]
MMKWTKQDVLLKTPRCPDNDLLYWHCRHALCQSSLALLFSSFSEAILKAIIESATGQRSNLENLYSLQCRVRQELNQKRYLLILDDVWNENQEDWVRLECILACGSIGASVIVTTRLKKVADIVRTLPALCLTMLTEEQCWLLFKLRAFGKENDQHPNLEIIGRRIVKKCGGVPLVVKALGGLLRDKREENEWIRVEESHVWNLPEEENSILSVLRLSYRHLPFVLKRCFAYCAVFPKDYVFVKEKLIFHWMAHGCISSDGNEDVEDVGDQIWNELAVRSFFQEVRTKGKKQLFQNARSCSRSRSVNPKKQNFRDRNKTQSCKCFQ